MKKLQNLGRALSKIEQKRIIGGGGYGCTPCEGNGDCPDGTQKCPDGSVVEATGVCDTKITHCCRLVGVCVS